MELIGLILACAIISALLVVSVFGWGYNKEQNGERTDFLGRPNNHLTDNQDEGEMD